MNIFSTQFNNKYVSFGAHNKNVRKADDIMRLGSNAFPMSSATRYNTFCQKRKNFALEQQETINELQRRINQQRHDAEKKQETVRYISNPYMPHLKAMKKSRIGNCYESALSSIAALQANGYNGNIASLSVIYSVHDKKHQNVAFDKEFVFDHVFVITDMGQKETTADKKIVLDSWLGICGTWQEVSSKYNMLCSEDDEVKTFLHDSRQEFLEELKKNSPDLDLSCFEEKLSFKYWSIPPVYLKDRKIKKQIKRKFPELVLNLKT